MSHQTPFTIKFFGHCRSLVGAGEATVMAPQPATASDLLTAACQQFPSLATLSGKLLIAVNEAYALPHQTIEPQDEIAIFPPVSGGQNENELVEPDFFVRITHEEINTRALVEGLQRGEDGAVVTFEGVVRNNTKGRKTLYLEYEAYVPMALKTMRQVAEEAKAAWEIDRLAIVHRLGRIEIGGASVVIVVTSPHRKAAFDACRFAIDRLKQIVPIWKREFFEDGDVWVDGEIERYLERSKLKS
ncbi:MAG: molybdenum cofactor biosynthesis protein MoaE [Blastocatellia bacterium]|nr:molybdenum cofactor biosynthesis protein MoaE [Blastocatellia bacterium]